MDLGIIGKSRSGKTSLFNAVTRGSAQVGAYSAADKPNVGVVEVPDPRVDALAAVFSPKKTTFAKIRWVDFPVGEFGADGPGRAFVADLASLDALVHVVRAFEDAALPHANGSVDPARDLEALDLELTFADLELIERRLERIEKEARTLKVAQRTALDRDRDLLLELRKHLEDGQPLRTLALSEEDEKELRKYQFVTSRPMLTVVNLGEDQLDRAEAFESELAAHAVCAKLEAELAQLPPDEAEEFRKEVGLPEDLPMNRAIVAAYELLGLQSFLTCGEDECRAWPLRKGATARDAAGAIHSDLERGFIRAEVASWQDVVDAGSMHELKKRGKLRTEGRTYVVEDGDVLNVLFNV